MAAYSGTLATEDAGHGRNKEELTEAVREATAPAKQKPKGQQTPEALAGALNDLSVRKVTFARPAPEEAEKDSVQTVGGHGGRQDPRGMLMLGGGGYTGSRSPAQGGVQDCNDGGGGYCSGPSGGCGGYGWRRGRRRARGERRGFDACGMTLLKGVQGQRSPAQ